jgi:hypothetical protein
MEELEAIIESQRTEVQTLAQRRRVLETQLRELAQKFEVAEARLGGLLAAHEIVKAQKEKEEARPQVRKRQRRLTDQWRQILGMLANHTFTYDDLASVAIMQEHDISRDTLRSQMSVYKASGIVEPIEDGVFRLTDRGRVAAGLTEEIGSDDDEEVSDDELV